MKLAPENAVTFFSPHLKAPCILLNAFLSKGHAAMKRSKKEEPPPQKLMDDLFLKTKATPSIYWQPLSPEEVSTLLHKI